MLIWEFGTEYIIRSLTIGMQYQGIKISGVAAVSSTRIGMEIVYEVNVTEKQNKAIMMLRNQSFPKHQVARSYFKQLPHLRALQYEGDVLVGYLGLDYRVIKVGEEVHRVLGIVDFCVAEHYRGQGIGTLMLSEVSLFCEGKGVDFIILVSELQSFYSARGYIQVKAS